ncbi:MAG: hypothetical protein QOK37_4657 [Thermoanaerobaculia bacterium]|jgi:hypothetical protein|nr:hypothetical protein [Thermoanaerobaculia bacterium]
MRVLSLLAAAGIAAGAFEPFYVRIFNLDRSRVAAMLTELPYKKLPGLRPFLVSVRAQTKDGDVIALAAPLHRAHWQGGYDYLYARALYLLSGRQVLPLLDPADRPHLENLAKAKYIAGYRCDPQTPGFAVIWRSQDGELLRRIK